MISLKKTIEAFDYRVMFEAAMQSYRSTLDNLEKTAIVGEREWVADYKDKLRELQRRIAPGELRPDVLQAHSEEVKAQLVRYKEEIEGLLTTTGNNLRDVVGVLAKTTETLSQRDNLHGTQLSRISGSLEAISQSSDIEQIRKQLTAHVRELRTCINQMTLENDHALQSLQQDLKSFQQRLQKVQVEASTDPLTSVANRRRAGNEIATRMRERRAFGILLFDLNRFKEINDTHGHAAGDLILQIVAEKLQSHVRKEDLVCRWGGDEFVVVHEGYAEELKESASTIAKRIGGTISIQLGGAEHEVTIGAEAGWAAYISGETAEELFARADKLLYETKRRRPAVQMMDAPSLAVSSPTAGVPEGVPAVEADVPVPNSLASSALEQKSAIAALRDPATGLPGIAVAEAVMTEFESDASAYFVGCFAIRRAAFVNSHYGYAATEELLPFLRDRIMSTRFNGRLFRGPGACILALVNCPGGHAALEHELTSIAGMGWEEHISQKRRSSKLPVGVRGRVIPLKGGVPAALREISAFLNLHYAGETSAVA